MISKNDKKSFKRRVFMQNNFSNLFTQQNYFDCYFNLCLKYSHKKLIVTEIKRILKEMEALITTINADNSFHIMAKLFGMDSRLQIISSFIDDDNLTESELISLQEKDYQLFMKEIIGQEINNEQLTIYHLVT